MLMPFPQTQALRLEEEKKATSSIAAPQRGPRLLWAGLAFAVLMLIGISACALAPIHASAQPSRICAKVYLTQSPSLPLLLAAHPCEHEASREVAFNPALPLARPTALRPASGLSALRPVGQPPVSPAALPRAHIRGSTKMMAAAGEDAAAAPPPAGFEWGGAESSPAEAEGSPAAATAVAEKPKKEKPKNTEAWKEGIFAPGVLAAKAVLGEQELKELRASVIKKHSKVIADFVDTSESQFGQIVLKRMFEFADKDDSGDLDREEVKSALQDLGFDFMDDKQVDSLMKKADGDKNAVIDFEEFVTSTPKALRINLVKLAKQNGHDLGFLV